MLPDFERKLLRILFNFSHANQRMPTINELQRKTGRNKNGIMQAFLYLEKEEFIIWEDRRIERIKLLKAWET